MTVTSIFCRFLPLTGPRMWRGGSYQLSSFYRPFSVGIVSTPPRLD